MQASAPGPALDRSASLRAYGITLYNSDSPLYLFVEAILGVRDEFPHWRREMGLAWQTAARWEADEPSEHRAVLPVPAIRALVAIALLWQWWSVAGCILLGFSGMLRPVEWLSATRGALLLPSDLLEPGIMYVSILAPKTRRVYRRQHVRIDEAAIIDYSCARWGNAAADAKLFALSSGSFRTRWNAIARAVAADVIVRAGWIN